MKSRSEIERYVIAAAAAIFIAGIAGTGLAQTSNSGPGASASSVGSSAASVAPGSASGTTGSAGSAAAGDTSASSIGLGAESAAPGKRSRSLSTGASASAPDGRAISRSRTRGRNGQSIGVARDGGEVSVSHTGTHLRRGEMNSNTQTLAREPGSRPVRSKSSSSVDLGR